MTPIERKPVVNGSAVYFPLTVERTATNCREIAIVVIIYDNKTHPEYVLPQSTLRCYAQAHEYLMIEINLKRNAKYLKRCPAKDFMFQRHCVMAELMEERPEVEWFVFLDADIGVVNPNHLLEEYTHPEADLIFYDRLYNYEIVSGSYLARNTPFARSFLKHWAQYEYRVKEGTVHGTDNGAISEVFLDYFCSTCAPERRARCTEIWHDSHNYDDLFRYESCAREILGPAEWFRNEKGTLRQLSMGRGYWCRDGWQTQSKWADEDFMFHGWKENKRNGEWTSMFTAEDFNEVNCRSVKTVHLNWAYNSTFRTSVEMIRSHLMRVARGSYEGHLKRLEEVNKLPI